MFQDMDEDEDSSSESETEDLEEILVGERNVEMKTDPDTVTDTGEGRNDATAKEEEDLDDVEIIDISQKASDSEDDVKIVEEPSPGINFLIFFLVTFRSILLSVCNVTYRLLAGVTHLFLSYSDKFRK